MHTPISSEFGGNNGQATLTEGELFTRVADIVADLVQAEPVLMVAVSGEVRGRVSEILEERRISLPEDFDSVALSPDKDLPTFLLSAIDRADRMDGFGSGLMAHLWKVGSFAYNLATDMRFDYEERRRTRIAALLHDIGKLDRVSRPNILSPLRLSPEQKADIRLHSLVGERVLQNFGFTSEITDLVLRHHFRFDGTGYPAQNGEDMSKEVGVLGVVDAFDSMLGPRPGRNSKESLEALLVLRNGSGKHFHPDAVKAFVSPARRFVIPYTSE
ncbi:MAG: HD domain-containing phosphohydrolase [Candidatus Gracilibacteria bacterium]|jgi:putative nucleotidyltransferase with HDIG domain